MIFILASTAGASTSDTSVQAVPWATFTINQFGVEATSYVGIRHRVVETDASLAQTNITGAGDGGIELDVVDGVVIIDSRMRRMDGARQEPLEV